MRDIVTWRCIMHLTLCQDERTAFDGDHERQRAHLRRLTLDPVGRDQHATYTELTREQVIACALIIYYMLVGERVGWKHTRLLI